MSQHTVSLSPATHRVSPCVLSPKPHATLCFTAVSGAVPRALRLVRAKHDPVVMAVQQAPNEARWTAEISVAKLGFDAPVTEWSVQVLYPADPAHGRTAKSMYRTAGSDEQWRPMATVKLVRPSHLKLHLVSTLLAATGLLALVPLVRARAQLSSGLMTVLIAILIAALYSLTIGVKLRSHVRVSRVRAIAFALPVLVVAAGAWVLATQAVTVRNAVHHGEVMHRFGYESYWLVSELATQRREFLQPELMRLEALSTVAACAPVSRDSAWTSKVWAIDCVAPWQRMNAEMREAMLIPHPGGDVPGGCVDRLPDRCAMPFSAHDTRSVSARPRVPIESAMELPSRYDHGHWFPSVSGQFVVGTTNEHNLLALFTNSIQKIQVSVWGSAELREVSLRQPRTAPESAIWNVDRTHRRRTRTQFELQILRSAQPAQLTLGLTGHSPISVLCPKSEYESDGLVLDVITTHEAALVAHSRDEYSVHVQEGNDHLTVVCRHANESYHLLLKPSRRQAAMLHANRVESNPFESIEVPANVNEIEIALPEPNADTFRSGHIFCSINSVGPHRLVAFDQAPIQSLLRPDFRLLWRFGTESHESSQFIQDFQRPSFRYGFACLRDDPPNGAMAPWARAVANISLTGDTEQDSHWLLVVRPEGGMATLQHAPQPRPWR